MENNTYLTCLLFLIVVQCLCTSSCYEFKNNIHNFMTEPELEYYFGTDKEFIKDYDIVYLPVLKPKLASEGFFTNTKEALYDNTEPINYNFDAFGKTIELKLLPNQNLIGPSFKTFVTDDYGSQMLEPPNSNCHYLHNDEDIVAAISSCHENFVDGLVFLKNLTLEIRPLTPRLQSFLKLEEALVEEYDSDIVSPQNVPHIIKRAIFKPNLLYDEMLPYEVNNLWENNEDKILTLRNQNGASMLQEEYEEDEHNIDKRASNKMTLEVAVFFDAAGYKLFSKYMGNNEKRMRDMLLAYMNGVHALYQHPSLGTAIDIVIVRMDLMKSQPKNMPHYNGERSKLLDSFCDYQKSINPAGDSNPNHWDMGLYISGLDFYAIENGRKSGITMGLATVGGVCMDKYACVIAEFGTTNVFGKPYPSAGFTSVYILAHEIGHNLGMHHDSSGNNCPKEGYIMSPSRGTTGETQWSGCSAQIMKNLAWAKCLFDKPKKPSAELDHSKFLNMPGQRYSAKKQCEILLRDKDAMVFPKQDSNSICNNLQCKTPHRSGYYFAGPALEGTVCAKGKVCYGGDCVKFQKPTAVISTPGGWSDWDNDVCQSGCIEKSMGWQSRHRSCNNPSPINTETGCEGPSFDVKLCKDNKICKKRQLVSKHATNKCKEFSKKVIELDPNGPGLQAPHEEARPWMGCAIFCRRADGGSYYTPRMELNDMGISAYFPDGTWCHKDAVENYYCLQHHCLPESFQFTKTSLMHGIGEDIPFPQNAHPNDIPVPPSLLSYLSLDIDGKPLQTTLRPGQTNPPKDEDWETQDYIELPSDMKNQLLINEIDNTL